jgi:hypothetical protein
MQLHIYCPNCNFDLGKKTFSELGEPYEISCDNCNTLFVLELLESSEKENKLHDDLIFNLTVDVENPQLWDKVNEDLLPILKCVLCVQKVELGKSYDSEQIKKCGICGAGYYIDLVKDTENYGVI